MKSAYLTAENANEKIEEWFAKLNKKHWKTLDLSRAALLVVDVQGYFTDPTSHAFVPSIPAVLPKIEKLVKLFQEKKRPVVHTIFAGTPKDKDPILEWWGHTVRTGTPDAELSIPADPKSLVLRKTVYNAFHESPLHDYLQLNQIESVLITGVLSNLCCESTARAAFDHGYQVFFVLDATASYSEDHHLATLLNLSNGVATPLSTHQIHDL